jgi:hypothetical protein
MQKEKTKTGLHPLSNSGQPEVRMEPEVPTDFYSDTSETVPQVTDTPNYEYHDPTYPSPQTARSRRELQTTRVEPPLTRSRARIMSRDPVMSNRLSD